MKMNILRIKGLFITGIDWFKAEQVPYFYWPLFSNISPLTFVFTVENSPQCYKNTVKLSGLNASRRRKVNCC